MTESKVLYDESKKPQLRWRNEYSKIVLGEEVTNWTEHRTRLGSWLACQAHKEYYTKIIRIDQRS